MLERERERYLFLLDSMYVVIIPMMWHHLYSIFYLYVFDGYHYWK